MTNALRVPENHTDSPPLQQNAQLCSLMLCRPKKQQDEENYKRHLRSSTAIFRSGQLSPGQSFDALCIKLSRLSHLLARRIKRTNLVAVVYQPMTGMCKGMHRLDKHKGSSGWLIKS